MFGNYGDGVWMVIRRFDFHFVNESIVGHYLSGDGSASYGMALGSEGRHERGRLRFVVYRQIIDVVN